MVSRRNLGLLQGTGVGEGVWVFCGRFWVGVVTTAGGWASFSSVCAATVLATKVPIGLASGFVPVLIVIPHANWVKTRMNMAKMMTDLFLPILFTVEKSCCFNYIEYVKRKALVFILVKVIQ